MTLTFQISIFAYSYSFFGNTHLLAEMKSGVSRRRTTTVKREHMNHFFLIPTLKEF